MHMQDPFITIRRISTEFFNDVEARYIEFKGLLKTIFLEEVYVVIGGKQCIQYDYRTSDQALHLGNSIVICDEENYCVPLFEWYLEEAKVSLLNKLHDTQKEFYKPDYINFVLQDLKQITVSVSKLELGNQLDIYRNQVMDKLNSFSIWLEDSFIKTSTISTIQHKIKWLGDVNQLGTLFFDLLAGQKLSRENQRPPLIEVKTKKLLVDFIVNNFCDQTGIPLSTSSFNDFLNPSKPEKRAKNDKQIILP